MFYGKFLSVARVLELAVSKETLIARLQDARPEVRADAASKLGAKGEVAAGAVQMIAALLKDGDDDVCFAAARALGRFGAPAAGHTPALLEAMQREFTPIRSEAMQSIISMGARAFPHVLEALLNGTADAKHDAALVLVRMPDSIQTLSEAFARGNAETRHQAVWALGLTKDVQATDVLVKASKDADPVLRSAAVWAFGKLRANTPEAVAAIKAALHDAEPEVQANAFEVLRKIEAKTPPATQRRLEEEASAIVPVAHQTPIRTWGLLRLLPRYGRAEESRLAPAREKQKPRRERARISR